jgi:hypothetical protein
MSPKITATHERVDDIPAIIAHLKKMRVAEGLDTHFPTHGNWEGLSLGWTTVVWLTFILSEGDHRLYRAEPWVKEHPHTLRRCIGRTVRPRDLADDRLATILDYPSARFKPPPSGGQISSPLCRPATIALHILQQWRSYGLSIWQSYG